MLRYVAGQTGHCVSKDSGAFVFRVQHFFDCLTPTFRNAGLKTSELFVITEWSGFDSRLGCLNFYFISLM